MCSRHSYLQSSPLSIIATFVFIIGIFGSHSIFASQIYNDVVVSVESMPADKSVHGYAEYKISVKNNSLKLHEVTVFAPFKSFGHADYIRRLSRSIVLSPNSSTTVSIFQLPLSMRGDGLGVIIDGQTQREPASLDPSQHCSDNFYIPYNSKGHNPLCILLSQNINLDDFRNGIETTFWDYSGKHSGLGAIWRLTESESQVDNWSDNWLAYSCYDGIILTASDMCKMPVSVRSAILQYVQCGGSLLVLGRWEKPEDWRDRESIPGLSDFSYIHFGICNIIEDSDITKWQVGTWNRLRSQLWEPTASELLKRTTISEANKKFPIVTNLAIPVKALFVLVLISGIIIGPVSLIVLSRIKRWIWLVWVVPSISIVISLSVFLYACFAEGWKGHIRISSITILEEATHRTTTIGVGAFYCPLTPHGGLHFENDTEVTPMGFEMWSWRGRGRGKTIDWTHDQHLESGWITARVPAHFMLRKSQMRKECLEIAKTKDNQVTVLNHLGANIRQLWFADKNGKIYTGKNVPADATVLLNPSGSSILPETESGVWRDIYTSDWVSSSDRIIENGGHYLSANSYIAILDNSVFLECPLNNALKTADSESIVFGILKDSPDAD